MKEVYNLTLIEAEEELRKMFDKYYECPSKNMVECHLLNLLIKHLKEIENALTMFRTYNEYEK